MVREARARLLTRRSARVDRDMPQAPTVAVTKPDAGDGEVLLDQVEVVDVARTGPAAQGVPGILDPLIQPGGDASPSLSFTQT